MKQNKSRKNFLKIIGLMTLVIMLSFSGLLVGCKEEEPPTVPLIFGEFDYNGKYLYDFATADITAVEAKNLITSGNTSGQALNASKIITLNASKPAVPSDKITYILQEYSSCIITTKYYIAGKEEQQTKHDELQGTDFRAMLEANEISPFNQLIAKNIVMYPELIDYMEESNNEFKVSEISTIAPFKDVFTYHKNETGNLVIKTRDFAEIPASTGGGIGCSFRQDTEILYDADHKISKWQTSLGLWSTTPNGTSKQGYILEVEFKWVKKV